MTHSRIITTIFFLLFVCLLNAQTQYKKHGRNVISDAQGNVSVGRTKNYLREGKWYESYPNHAKKSFGKYHLGLAEGRHIMYWPNGKVSSIRDYMGGKHNGQWIEFNENGDTTEHLNFKLEMLHGYYFAYDSVFQVTKESGTYVNGKKSGWCVAGGAVITDSSEYKDGKRNGKQIIRALGEYYSVGYFKDDKEDGVFKTYGYGELEREYCYVMGKCTKSLVYYPRTDSVCWETRYKAPDDISMYIRYYRSGAYEKVEWYSKQHLDSITEYYANGKIRCRYVYRAREFGFRQLVRQYVGYDSLGRLMYVHYCNTQGQDSLHRYLGTDGKLIREMQYVNGSMYGQKYFYPDGKPMVLFTNDTISVYSETGKKLRPATSAYSKTFSMLDSIESAWPDHVPFPPTIGGYPVDPALAASDFEETVTYADENPEFPGGADSLKTYLMRNIAYPQIYKETAKEGTVHVQFIIEKNGMITHVVLLRGVVGYPEFGTEAVRVVTAMPNWTPGYYHYHPVRYKMTLPIAFRLD